MPNKGLGRCFSLIWARERNNVSLALTAGGETAETRLITRYICNLHLIEHKQARVAKVNGVKATEMPGRPFSRFRIHSSLTRQGKISSIKQMLGPIFPSVLVKNLSDLPSNQEGEKRPFNRSCSSFKKYSPLLTWHADFLKVKHWKRLCWHAHCALLHWALRMWWWFNSSIQNIWGD